MTVVDVSDVFSNVISGLAILVAGSWAFRKYVLRLEDDPRIEFFVDVNFVGLEGDEWVVEILAFIENKGDVPHTIKEIYFGLRALERGKKIELGDDKIHGQAYFSELLSETTWMSKAQQEGQFGVLYPGISMRYNYVYKIPPNLSFLLLHGTLTLDAQRAKPLRAVNDKVLAVPTKEDLVRIDKKLSDAQPCVQANP